MQISSRPRQVGLTLLIALICMLVWQAPMSAQDPTEAQLELGRQLYTENCAVCHGLAGEGRVGATLAKNWPSIRPDLRVKSVIERGISGSPMPAWSQKNGGPLTDEEIEALTLYILSWETGGLPTLSATPTFTPRPPIATVPNVEGDPNRGSVLYAENCAVCHGPNGQGRVGAKLAKNWPSIRADLRIKTTIERGVPGSQMPAWAQAYGGPLSDEDINDVVAFVMSWQAQSEASDLPPTPARAPSALSGPLGALVLIAALLALALVGIIGALTRRG